MGLLLFVAICIAAAAGVAARSSGLSGRRPRRSLTRRRAAVRLAVTVLAVSAAACSSSGDKSAAVTSTSRPPSTIAPATIPTPTTAPEDTRGIAGMTGLILHTCYADSEPTITVINPDSGSAIKTVEFESSGRGCLPTDDNGHPRAPVATRANFDLNYWRLSRQVNSDSGAEAVGWITASGVETTIEPPEGGFSQPVHYRYETWAPGTDQLWFRSTGPQPRLWSVDVGVGSVTPADKGPSRGEGYIFVGPPGFAIEAGMPWPLPHPTRPMMALGGQDGITLREPSGERRARIGRPCQPQSFVGETGLLCNNGYSTFYVAEFDAAFRAGRARDLIPAVPGRSAYGPVASPDGQWVAFMSCTSTQCDLFKVPIGGGVEPVKIGDGLGGKTGLNGVSSDRSTLLEWR